MNTLIAAITLTLSITLPALDVTDQDNKWTTLPQGAVVLQKGNYWVVYPSRIVSCRSTTLPSDDFVIFEVPAWGAPGACYQVHKTPLGYYTDDPTGPKSYKMEFHPWVQ